MPRQPSPTDRTPGLSARLAVAFMVDGVIRRHRPLDEALETDAGVPALPERDRALARRMAATVLRRLGTLRALLGTFLARGFPAEAPRVETALLTGAAQILFLEIPDHAAVDLAVRSVQADRRAARYAGLVNAVLRRVTREGRGLLASIDPTLDTPDWLRTRWARHYGEDVARAIARANAAEPALDLTVKDDPARWAATLGGRALATGAVRLGEHGAVSQMPGFAEGEWWVQDAAAALPARLLGDVRGKRVADLCAAPGGKTAQLALAGATVIAVDRSEPRLKRLRQNLERLKLTADTVVADAAEWTAPPFDAVLVDAPCSSTGTIRRHPDIAWTKREDDLAPLTALQRRLLDNAVALTGPGGTLVYCVCSLEPEEGPAIVAARLAVDPSLRRLPIASDEIGGQADWLTPEGDLRTLPHHLPDSDPQFAGLDGFYAARLRKI